MVLPQVSRKRSAAFVMVAVFSIFATLSFIDFKQMGVGLAAAILIDATVIRRVLLPATMKLLGERNWYLPSWLEWLPKRRSGVPHDDPGGRPAGAAEGVGQNQRSCRGPGESWACDLLGRKGRVS